MYDRSLLAVGFVLVVAVAGLSSVGPVVAADGATTGNGADSTELALGADGAGPTANVSAVAALRLAENVTNGTSVGMELEEEGGSPVYDVTVIQRDGVLVEIIVDADEARILRATANPDEVIEADEDDDSGEDDGAVFDEPAGDPAGNLSSVDLRSAVVAVTNASNATVDNRTVAPNATATEVELQRNGSAYRYAVEFRSPTGERTEGRVNATSGEVLAVEKPV